MASRYRIKCLECGKSGIFIDAKDLTQAKWRILAWDVKTGDPKAVCEKCEYKLIGKK